MKRASMHEPHGSNAHLFWPHAPCLAPMLQHMKRGQSHTCSFRADWADRTRCALRRKHPPRVDLMKYLHIVAFVEPRIIGRDREFGPGISAKLEKGAHCTSSSTTPHRRYTIGAQVKVQPARDRRAGGRPSMQSLT